MAKKKKKRVPVDTSGSLLHSPFSSLAVSSREKAQAAGRSEGSGGHASEQPRDDDRSATSTRANRRELPAKIILRKQRKGRGGKTVTLVEGLETLAQRDVQQLAKRLRSALGCGSSIDGSTVVLQGDLGSRAEEWLRAKGAKKVVRSG